MGLTESSERIPDKDEVTSSILVSPTTHSESVATSRVTTTETISCFMH